MAFKDLRDFIKKLKEVNQFVELKKEIENGYNVSALGIKNITTPRPWTHLKTGDSLKRSGAILKPMRPIFI